MWHSYVPQGPDLEPILAKQDTQLLQQGPFLKIRSQTLHAGWELAWYGMIIDQELLLDIVRETSEFKKISNQMPNT